MFRFSASCLKSSNTRVLLYTPNCQPQVTIYSLKGNSKRTPGSLVRFSAKGLMMFLQVKGVREMEFPF